MNAQEIKLPSPVTTEPASDPRTEAAARIEQEGRLIAEAFPGIMLASIAGKHLGSLASPAGFRSYLEKQFGANSSSTNPVEQMLQQEFALAHFTTGNLLAEAAANKMPEMMVALGTLAVKLMAEARKTGVVLLELQQRNAGGMAGQEQIQNSETNIELGSKHQRDQSHAEPAEPTTAHSPSNCRPAKPLKTQGVHRRRSTAAA